MDIKKQNEPHGALTKDSVSDYLRRADVGSIVAFSMSGKAVSGVIKAKADTEVTIETKNGTVFGNVPYTDVLWVKTGNRWPRWVFDLLKKK